MTPAWRHQHPWGQRFPISNIRLSTCGNVMIICDISSPHGRHKTHRFDIQIQKFNWECKIQLFTERTKTQHTYIHIISHVINTPETIIILTPM